MTCYDHQSSSTEKSSINVCLYVSPNFLRELIQTNIHGGSYEKNLGIPDHFDHPIPAFPDPNCPSPVSGHVRRRAAMKLSNDHYPLVI
jgi:hypothetical protein